MKGAREIFAPVDPQLRIIGGHRHRKSAEKNWEDAGGAVCPLCGEEAVRFRPEDGVCRQCADRLNEKQIKGESKQVRWLKHVKAHNARIRRRG